MTSIKEAKMRNDSLHIILKEYFKDSNYYVFDDAVSISIIKFSVNNLGYVAFLNESNLVSIAFETMESAINVANVFKNIDEKSMLTQINDNFLKLNRFFNFVFNENHDFPVFESFKDIFDIYKKYHSNKFNELRYLFQVGNHPFYMNVQLLLTFNFETKLFELKDYYHYDQSIDMYEDGNLKEFVFETTYKKLIHNYITKHIGVDLENATEEDKIVLKMVME